MKISSNLMMNFRIMLYLGIAYGLGVISEKWELTEFKSLFMFFALIVFFWIFIGRKLLKLTK